jgi:hypothetical protein
LFIFSAVDAWSTTGGLYPACKDAEYKDSCYDSEVIAGKLSYVGAYKNNRKFKGVYIHYGNAVYIGSFDDDGLRSGKWQFVGGADQRLSKD